MTPTVYNDHLGFINHLGAIKFFILCLYPSHQEPYFFIFGVNIGANNYPLPEEALAKDINFACWTKIPKGRGWPFNIESRVTIAYPVCWDLFNITIQSQRQSPDWEQGSWVMDTFILQLCGKFLHKNLRYQVILRFETNHVLSGSLRF